MTNSDDRALQSTTETAWYPHRGPVNRIRRGTPGHPPRHSRQTLTLIPRKRGGRHSPVPVKSVPFPGGSGPFSWSPLPVAFTGPLSRSPASVAGDPHRRRHSRPPETNGRTRFHRGFHPSEMHPNHISYQYLCRIAGSSDPVEAHVRDRSVAIRDGPFRDSPLGFDTTTRISANPHDPRRDGTSPRRNPAPVGRGETTGGDLVGFLPGR